MRKTTLCFLLKDGKVLLGEKKRGFGMGKWNGVGGKVDEGEEIKAATVREVQEEISVIVDPDDLRTIGVLKFRFNDHTEWDQDCFVFSVEKWKGEPAESEELRPQWYAYGDVPFQKMWLDDQHWFHLMLAGKKFDADFLFSDSGNRIVTFSVREVA